MFDSWWPCAWNARLAGLFPGCACIAVRRNTQSRKNGNTRNQFERQEADQAWAVLWARSTTLTDRRKGISDVDPGSISGTISGTLPPLSPGTWAGFWLHDPVNTRVMGPSITPRKESHGGGCAPRDIGSGFDDKGSGRLKTLFCKARRRRVGLLAELKSLLHGENLNSSGQVFGKGTAF